MLYLGRLMELGEAETVFGPPQHPYTEALLSAVPERGRRASAPRIRLEGEIPSHADPPSGCVFHTRCPRYIGDICKQRGAASSRRSSPGTSGAATTPSRSCASCRSRRRPGERRRRRRERRVLRIRAAVLERVGAPLEVDELELAPPGPGEVLVRLHASGVCHSDLNAIDGTAPTRCPAVLGHEGAGRGGGGRPGRARLGAGHARRALVAARLRRAARSACATCRTCARRRGRRWTHGGLLDGTTRLSRDGEPVFHYSLLSAFAERAVVPAACCVPIPDDVPLDVAGARRLRGHHRHRRGLADGRRAARASASRARLRRRRDERGARRRGGRRRPDRRRRRRASDKLEAALRLGATHAVRVGGRRRGDRRRRCCEATGGGVDYAFEATGRPEAARARVPLHARARRRRADRHPARRRRAALPALSIPRLERRVLGSVYGSARPERDFPALLDALPPRAPAARPAGHRAGCRSTRSTEGFDLLRGGARCGSWSTWRTR